MIKDHEARLPQRWEPMPSHSSWHPNIRIQYHLLSIHAKKQHGVVYLACQGANWDGDRMVPCTHMSTTPTRKTGYLLSASKKQMQSKQVLFRNQQGYHAFGAIGIKGKSLWKTQTVLSYYRYVWPKMLTIYPMQPSLHFKEKTITMIETFGLKYIQRLE